MGEALASATIPRARGRARARRGRGTGPCDGSSRYCRGAATRGGAGYWSGRRRAGMALTNSDGGDGVPRLAPQPPEGELRVGERGRGRQLRVEGQPLLEGREARPRARDHGLRHGRLARARPEQDLDVRGREEPREDAERPQREAQVRRDHHPRVVALEAVAVPPQQVEHRVDVAVAVGVAEADVDGPAQAQHGAADPRADPAERVRVEGAARRSRARQHVRVQPEGHLLLEQRVDIVLVDGRDAGRDDVRHLEVELDVRGPRVFAADRVEERVEGQIGRRRRRMRVDDGALRLAPDEVRLDGRDGAVAEGRREGGPGAAAVGPALVLRGRVAERRAPVWPFEAHQLVDDVRTGHRHRRWRSNATKPLTLRGAKVRTGRCERRLPCSKSTRSAADRAS